MYIHSQNSNYLLFHQTIILTDFFSLLAFIEIDVKVLSLTSTLKMILLEH